MKAEYGRRWERKSSLGSIRFSTLSFNVAGLNEGIFGMLGPTLKGINVQIQSGLRKVMAMPSVLLEVLVGGHGMPLATRVHSAATGIGRAIRGRGLRLKIGRSPSK